MEDVMRELKFTKAKSVQLDRGFASHEIGQSNQYENISSKNGEFESNHFENHSITIFSGSQHDSNQDFQNVQIKQKYDRIIEFLENMDVTFKTDYDISEARKELFSQKKSNCFNITMDNSNDLNNLFKSGSTNRLNIQLSLQDSGIMKRRSQKFIALTNV